MRSPTEEGVQARVNRCQACPVRDVTWAGVHVCPPSTLTSIADGTHQALLDVPDIPERDRFQVITERDADHVIALDAGLGFERSDRLVMIQIFTQSGCSTEVKQRLFHTIAEQLEPLGISGEDVFIGMLENGPQDWSFGFGRAQYTEGDLAVPGR